MLVEDSGREVGVRETTPMRPERAQPALAEAMSFDIGMEVFVEGAFARGLYENGADAMAVWRATRSYNRFFAANEHYYTGTTSLAPVAIVLDDRSESVALLDGLAARHVLFDVLYENDLNAQKLAHYKVVALLTTRTVRQRALAALKNYLRGGGKVIAAGDAATLDENGQKRTPPDWFGKSVGKGECIYDEELPAFDDLSTILRDAAGPGTISIDAPAGVLYNITHQPATGRTMIHFLSYSLKPTGGIKVQALVNPGGARLLSPDDPMGAPVTIMPSGDRELKVPSVRIYSMLVLENPVPNLKAVTH